jgi:hypothetical protein
MRAIKKTIFLIGIIGFILFSIGYWRRIPFETYDLVNEIKDEDEALRQLVLWKIEMIQNWTCTGVIVSTLLIGFFKDWDKEEDNY